MKNSNFIKNSIIALLPISFALGVVFVDKTESTPFNKDSITELNSLFINNPFCICIKHKTILNILLMLL